MKIPALLALATTSAVLAQSRPFPQHQTYAPGTLRVTSYSQTQQDTDVKNAYASWKSRYLVALGTTPEQYRIAFAKAGNGHTKTVSEGQGYGMVITALLAGNDPDAQSIFDGLWRFVRAHPSVNDARLMAWQIPTASGDTPDSAFDGDADIAFALLLANRQWGSAGGTDYQAAALDVIAGIKASTIGKNSRLPLLGDWVTGSTFTQWQTRSSDFMLDHFRTYQRASGDASWLQVVTAIQAVSTSLQNNYSPATGLLPDFIVAKSFKPYIPKPAPANFLEGPDDGAYSYNACRDPWRIGTDALLNNDANSLAHCRLLTNWMRQVTAGNPQKIRAGYRLNGTPISGGNYFTTAFAAPFGVAAMTGSGAAGQAWLNKLYTAIRLTREDYYEDSINLQCLLVMTGNWWDPTQP